MRGWVTAYRVIGAALVGLYGLAEWVGWERAAAAADRVPPSVRRIVTSSGGGGSSFWSSGFHGGK
jgi:hypothetical protein